MQKVTLNAHKNDLPSAWLAPAADSPAGAGPDLPEPAIAIDLAHELRTSLAILTLLSGNLDLLYERLDDDRRRRMIRDMRAQMQKLNNLIADALYLRDDEETPGQDAVPARG